MNRTNDRWLATLILFSGMLPWSNSIAADNGSATGDQGTLYVKGSLQEGPCHLMMRSAFQDVKLESSAIANLHNPGDTGKPQQMTFRLVGCRPSAGGESGGAGRDITAKFLSPADPDDPTLLRINGVTGVGLKLQDRKGRLVMPGEPQKLLFMSTAGDVVTYTVIPVRTTAPLTTGEFVATVDFGMSYD